jgi:hypothetical protein
LVTAHRAHSRWHENPFDELAIAIHEFRVANAGTLPHS